MHKTNFEKFFPHYKTYPSENQANQEEYVLNVLNEKRKGYYVEIGVGHWKNINNTYLLETQYEWVGFGLEIADFHVENYKKHRKNPCIKADAITFNYEHYFEKNNFPKQIDYLQIDIDPPEKSLSCLKNLPLSKYRFTVITFEHDLFQDRKNNVFIKQEAQEILKSHGYHMTAENIFCEYENWEFEDWWVDPLVIDINK
jgi:hypothetical protein